VRLAWLNDPVSYASRSIASGKASHSRQVKGTTLMKRDTLVLQVGGWAWG